MGAPQRLHPTDDARTAAERDDRQRLACTQVQQRTQLLARRGIEHRVGSTRWTPGAQAHEVGIALAGGVQDAIAVVVAHVLLAENLAQAGERVRGDGRRRELDVFERHGRTGPSGDANRLAQEAQSVRWQPLRMQWIAPPPPAHPFRRPHSRRKSP